MTKATRVASGVAAAAAAVFGVARSAHADVMPPSYMGPTPPATDCTDPTQTPCRAVVIVDQTIAAAPDVHSSFTPVSSTSTKSTLGQEVLRGTAINVGWTGCMAVDTSIALQNDYFVYTETLYRSSAWLSQPRCARPSTCWLREDAVGDTSKRE